MARRFLTPGLLAAALLLGSCAGYYGYDGYAAPVYYGSLPAGEPGTTHIGAFSTKSYTVPRIDPQGHVRVLSSGTVEVSPATAPEELVDAGNARALHVRVLASHDTGKGSWTLDTRKFELSLGEEGTSRPAFVNTDAGKPPVLRIPKGESRTIDLYYPLPADVSDAQLQSFKLVWQVKAGGELYAQTTALHRDVEIDTGPAYGSVSMPVYDDYGYDEGYAPYYDAPYYSGGYGGYGGGYAGYGYGGYGGYGYPYAYGYGYPGVSVGLGFGAYPYWYYDPFYPSNTFIVAPPVVRNQDVFVSAPRQTIVARPPGMDSHTVGSPSTGGPTMVGRPPSSTSVEALQPSMPGPTHVARPPSSPGPHMSAPPPAMHAPSSPGPTHIAAPPAMHAPSAPSMPAPSSPGPSAPSMPSSPGPTHIARPPG